MTDWVAAPIDTIQFCVIAITIDAVLYYISTFAIDWFAREFASTNEDDESGGDHEVEGACEVGAGGMDEAMLL